MDARPLTSLAAFAVACALSCSTEDGGTASIASGGTPPSSGGTATSASGGTTNTGGSSTVASGGTPSSGGGTPNSSGGTASSGGTTASGGSASSDHDSGHTHDAGAPGDLCNVGVWDGTPPRPLTLTGNMFAHDPTMIEADGRFYRFWTGDYVPSATSTDLRNWTNARTVYGNRYPSWSTEWLAGIPNESFNFPWAPDVSRFGGQYHLYSSFSAIFGDNVSCITHLTTSDLADTSTGGWTDHGPVVCTKGNERYNAIDPDVGTDAEGNAYLAFGSFWDGIMAFPLNADGTRAGTAMTRLAWAPEIEAPVLFRRCGYYYLFVTWGLCCPGQGRSVNQLTYRVVVGRSNDILGPYLARNGKPMLDGGGTLVVQGDHVTWAAAGHSDVLVTGGKIYHLFHAYRQSDGGAQLRIVPLPFDDEGWPVPGGP